MSRKGYIPSLTESLKDFNDELEKDPDLVPDFTQALQNMNAIGGALKTVIQPLIDLGSDPNIEEAFDTIAESDAFERLGDTAGDALPELAELVADLLDIAGHDVGVGRHRAVPRHPGPRRRCGQGLRRMAVQAESPGQLAAEDHRPDRRDVAAVRLTVGRVQDRAPHRSCGGARGLPDRAASIGTLRNMERRVIVSSRSQQLAKASRLGSPVLPLPPRSPVPVGEATEAIAGQGQVMQRGLTAIKIAIDDLLRQAGRPRWASLAPLPAPPVRLARCRRPAAELVRRAGQPARGAMSPPP